jgi:hypothetical protein
MRRRKNEKEAPEQQDAPEEPVEETTDPLDERLAPIEEFRGKADQWMKETAAQLARVATHVQQDEKRQHKLDERLAEFEDRIQAMLTLTEALSQGDNPFVRAPDAPPLQKSHAATPESDQSESPKIKGPGSGLPSGTGSQERPDKVSSFPQGNAALGREEEGEPAETEVIRPWADDQDIVEAAESGNPFIEAPDDDRPKGSHPNDASAESERDLPEEIWDDDGDVGDPSIKPIGGGAPFDVDTAREAEERLILLQLASLLARHIDRIDIDAYLETYLRTGWIDHRNVERVRALSTDLALHADHSSARLNREDVHIRTVLLLSRLSNIRGRRHKPPEDIVSEARSLVEPSWMRGA